MNATVPWTFRWQFIKPRYKRSAGLLNYRMLWAVALNH
jgi:hypothetical protein